MRGHRGGTRGRTVAVQVFVVEQFLGVHADGGTHVQAKLFLEALPLPSQALLRVHLTWMSR